MLLICVKKMKNKAYFIYPYGCQNSELLDLRPLVKKVSQAYKSYAFKNTYSISIELTKYV